MTADPTSDFFPGELVQATATARTQGAGAAPIIPYVWQFRAEVASGGGVLIDSGQTLGDHNSDAVSLGDVDDDGDSDAFVTNDSGNRIWLNNSDGVFTDSGQSLGDGGGDDVTLGDLDGDGDLDAFVLTAS